MLKDYGTVISTRILRKPDGVSRGVGFARMESKEKCDAVINAFNGKVLPGTHIKKYKSYLKFSKDINDTQGSKVYTFLKL